MKSILVTGGAGYIGSHTVNRFRQSGYASVVVDNLSNGFKEAIHSDAIFYQCDIRNESELQKIFTKHNISDVIHLAGLAIVEESFAKEKEYISNNYEGTRALLNVCKENKVKNLIFSSSSTIYGDANKAEKLTESHCLSATSPYAQSKQLCEEAIAQHSVQTGLNFINLRYFNVAGAADDLSNGQRGHGSNRLIFAAAQAALKGHSFNIYGGDYSTVDGSCVRDYIHVEDIADIHLSLLQHMQTNKIQKNVNCGYGEGFSVKQIVNKFKEINAVEFNVQVKLRRQGDPEYLVADNTELVKLLAWKSKYAEPLKEICRSAYQWEKKKLLL